MIFDCSVMPTSGQNLFFEFIKSVGGFAGLIALGWKFFELAKSYLNIKGENALLEACKKCFASLFTNRAISYRVDKKFSHFKVALSIGVQKMVRSDLASSGVMFSIDTETGFKNAVLINGA